MSVLYKALQKAEKENEARQSASSEGFDPQRLTASGALKHVGGRGRTVNRIALAGIIVLGVAGGGAFLFFQDQLAPAPSAPARPTAQANAPAPVVAAAPEAAPPAATPSEAAPVQLAGDAPSPQPAPAPASGETQTAQVAVAPPGAAPAATTPAAPEGAAPAASQPAAPAASSAAEAAPAAPSAVAPVETQVAAVPPVAAKPAAAQPAAKIAAPMRERPEPMPQIPVNSPARMLNPPVAINRAEFALAGVGDQVQVREVSQAARSNVAAGYEALIRGQYDTALGFYEAALADEPTSVLALLGRGAALQKLGRGQDAQGSYEQVLKIDPQNREALSNLTTIVAERSPQDAITRLLELEREYPTFSPVKAQIGLSYAKAGSMQQALDYFRRALVLSPETVMYHYNLALVLDHLGRREQAIASYERVLASLSGGRGPAELSPVDIERRVRFLRAR